LYSHLFYYHPHLPALHSFPTRRSSDLIFRELPVMGKFAQNYEIHSYPLSAKLLDALVMSYLDWGGSSAKPQIAHHQGIKELGAQDRKSTRLNSSHVAISYAVFCLKKKS